MITIRARPVAGQVEIVIPLVGTDQEFSATMPPADAERLAEVLVLCAREARGEGITLAEAEAAGATIEP